MACAILSDTVIFKSLHLQKRILRRVESWQRLPVLRDVRALGFEMFRVRSDFWDS